MQTHIMAGWCAANALPLSPRQRLLCMLASALPDLDGLGSLWSQEAYWAYHHKLGHNFAFGLLLAFTLAACSSGHRLKSALLYLALFHLHLFMDFWGSGLGWEIYYYWPLCSVGLKTSLGWEFYSWQNISTAIALFIGVLVIAVRLGRTPLELLMPSLDRQLVDWLRARTPGRSRP